jgi:hypothetical protein
MINSMIFKVLSESLCMMAFDKSRNSHTISFLETMRLKHSSLVGEGDLKPHVDVYGNRSRLILEI